MIEKKYELAAILETARKKIDAAQLLLNNNRNEDAVSRAYYAVFHALSAALLSKDFSYSSHSQVIGGFNREFIKTKIFPSDFSKKIQNLFDYRQTGDYSIGPLIDNEITNMLLNDARIIIEMIEKYLQSINAL